MAEIGDLVEIHWCDILTEDSEDLSQEEIQYLAPAPAVTWGKLLVLDEEKVVIAFTEFPPLQQPPKLVKKEYRNIAILPRCVVSKIVKLEVTK